MDKFFNKSLFERIISGSLFLLLFWSSLLYSSYLFSAFILIILLIILFTEWPKLINKNKFLFYLTPIYPIMPFVFIILLNTALYRILLINLFVSVFSFDTGAFIVGKLFGKDKIWPSISPGKTWQGVFGGFVSVLLAQIIFNYFKDVKTSLAIILCISYIISFLSFFGDLFESFLKRKANIKDSGKILPGHGGLLDRFDSILFAVVFFYLFKDKLLMIL